MLEATEQGLGSLWVCWFDPKIVREEFELPDNLEPINLLALGYADTEKKDRIVIKQSESAWMNWWRISKKKDAIDI